MSSGPHSLAPALRIARRDATRHPARSLLIVALIALPVMFLAALTVLYRSSTGTADDRADLVLGRAVNGAADAVIVAPAGAVSAQQSSFGEMGGWGFEFTDGDHASSLPPGSREPRPESDVLAALPIGASITEWSRVDVPALGPDGRYFPAHAELLDLSQPAAAGRFRVLAGRTPTGTGEVALTTALAARLAVEVGQDVTMGAPATRLSVVGVLEPLVPTNEPGAREAAVAMPGEIPAPDAIDGPTYLVKGATLPWSEIQSLNDQGLIVYSRSAATDPDAPNSSAAATTLVVGAIVLGLTMAIAQVVFLAGPAFAVGARRMRRQLAQFGATGGSPRQIRLVVLAGGLVLGTAGSLLGIALGVPLAIASHGFLAEHIGVPFVATYVRTSDLLVVFAIGLGTALLAALFPAVAASKLNLVVALSRAPGTASAARWWSVAGSILCATGIAITLGIAFRPVSEQDRASASMAGSAALAGGMLLAQVGLLLSTPLILQIASRWGSVLPTVPRLALRDTARHRGRSAPAVAAVLAVTSIAVAVTCVFATLQAVQDDAYRQHQPTGTVSIRAFEVVSGMPAAVPLSPITTVWPTARVVPLQSPATTSWAQTTNGAAPVSAAGWVEATIPPENLCPWAMSLQDNGVSVIDGRGKPPPSSTEMTTAAADWRCAGADFSAVTEQQAGVHSLGRMGNSIDSVQIGDEELRRLATGVDDSEGDAVLAGGGVLVLDRRYLDANNNVTLTEAHYDAAAEAPVVDRTITIPAVTGTWSNTPLTMIISPFAATRVGLAAQPNGVLVDPGPAGAVDDGQQDLDAIAQAIAATGVQPNTYLETGHSQTSETPSPWLILGLAALLICATVAVITALGVSDASADLSTLAAVGAPPRLRRYFSGWSALVVAAVGTVLGGILGLIPAFGLVRLIYQTGGFPQPTFVVPWGPILALVVGVSLFAFVMAALTTRSKIPVVPRMN